MEGGTPASFPPFPWGAGGCWAIAGGGGGGGLTGGGGGGGLTGGTICAMIAGRTIVPAGACSIGGA
jgi:hypothetical protein